MKLNFKLILIPFLFSTFTIFGQNVEIKVEVIRKVSVGDEFFLTFKINREPAEIKLESYSGDFKIDSIPKIATSSITKIVNGVMKKEKWRRFSYSLVANKIGVFTLPRTSIVFNDIEYLSDSVSINVVESLELEENNFEKTFVKLILSKDTVFRQEPIIAQLKLYSNKTIKSISRLQLPQNENFLLYDLSIPEKIEFKTDTFNNEILQSVLLKTFLLIPSKTGDFNINGIKIDCSVNKIELTNFSGLFDNPLGVRKTDVISKYSDSKAIHVTAYKTDLPNDFTYISGSDLEVSASLDKLKVKRNEQFKYDLSIAGMGNLKLLSTPNIQFPKNLKVLKVENDNDIKVDSLGISGERVFSFYLYSDSTGVFEIPPLSISYFDLSKNKFQRISSPTVSLNVEKGDSLEYEPFFDLVKSNEDLDKTKSKCATVIIIDLSESMLAQDFQPNRKSAVLKSINEYILETEQSIGIIVYSLIPNLLSPITPNKELIIKSLKTIDSLKLGDGTSTGMAICMALDKLKRINAEYKNIVLLTDGDSNTGSINERMAVDFAKQLNIPVNIIGLSSRKELVPITLSSENGMHTIEIPVKLDDDKYTYLSNQTGGRYYRVVNKETLKYAISEFDKNKNEKSKTKSIIYNYTGQEIQSMINLMYLDVLKEKEKISLKTK